MELTRTEIDCQRTISDLDANLIPGPNNRPDAPRGSGWIGPRSGIPMALRALGLIPRTDRNMQPSMSGTHRVALRPAGPDDEAFLLRVYASGREEELAATGWDEARKLAFLEMQYRAQSASYRANLKAWYDVIVVDGRDAGRLLVDRTASEISISDVGLLPEYRGRGIGTGLMRDVLDEAARARLPVRLYVEQFNPAFRLYQRLGFLPIGEHGVYVHMEWRPPAGPSP
jgi:ribosomal protein S18 acetylase RimI-like enzyme